MAKRTKATATARASTRPTIQRGASSIRKVAGSGGSKITTPGFKPGTTKRKTY